MNLNLLFHYLLVAVRNCTRHKAFSAINIIGLALGMTCCLFIYLWVNDEKSVDNFHANGKNLYTIYETINSSGNVSGGYGTPARYMKDHVEMVLGDAKETIPEIERMSFYATAYELPWGHAETFQVGETIHKLEGARASEDFLKMFSFPIIAGDVNNPLKDISSVAISRKMAEMFFKTPQNAIGKSVRHEDKRDFVVTAVFEDLPANSTFKFDYLMSWAAHLKWLEWASNYPGVYVQLKENANPDAVAASLNKLQGPRLNKQDYVMTAGLQRYGDVYLNGTFENGKPSGGRIEYVRIFSGVAIFILLMACINFMNLATARSVKRAKEVGVRKVVGSSRFHLIAQFFGEAILLSFFAVVLSASLVMLLLPTFNSFTGKAIENPLATPQSWLALTCLLLASGLVAGSYPALFLSSLKPARVLKGVVRFTTSAIWLRKGLATFQFGLSILLLIATIVISEQTNYVQERNLGYDRENIIYIRIEGELNPKYAQLKERALNLPGIAMVDRTTEEPHSMGFVVDMDDGSSETATGDDAILWEGKEHGVTSGIIPYSVGFDFLKILNLQVADGRGFSKAMATDSADAFMVNEEAVKQMGLKDPIGKWISAWKKKGHIVGVLKNFNTNSLHKPIMPVVVDVKEYEYFGILLIKTEPGKTKQALEGLQGLLKEINPKYPFVYEFMDQKYEQLYRNEQVMAKLSNVFAFVAIAISCLGLLGLVMFSAEQRVKEIGVRKVLGATVTNIIALLSQDFLVLVGLAFCIAAPVAAYFMNEWLKTFQFKIDLSWWIFAAAGGAAMLIALLTISVQAIQSATTNPVKSLRAE